MPGPVSATGATTRVARRRAAADRDRAAGRRVPERVRDEVGEHLADPDRVDVEDRQVAGTSAVTVTPAVSAAGRERADDLADEHVRVGRLRDGAAACRPRTGPPSAGRR